MKNWWVVLLLACASACASTGSADGGATDSGVESNGLPASHDFGKVMVFGDKPTWPLFLAPTADLAHLILSVEGPDAAAFSLTSDVISYETLNATITFTPTQAREYNAQLVVYGAGHTGRVRIDLVGKGTFDSARFGGRYSSFLDDGVVAFLAVGTPVGSLTATDDFMLRFSPTAGILSGLWGQKFDATEPQAKPPYLRQTVKGGLVAMVNLPTTSPDAGRLVYHWQSATLGFTPILTATEVQPQIDTHALVASRDGRQVVIQTAFRQPVPTNGKAGTDVDQCFWKDMAASSLVNVGDTGTSAFGCAPLGMAADGSEAIVYVDTQVGNKVNPAELRRVTAAGGQGSLIVLKSGSVEVNPKDVKVFSPDLSLAAVVTDKALIAADTDTVLDLYLVHRDGTPALRVSSEMNAALLAEAKIVGAANYGFSDITFSADGTHVGFIAFVNNGYGNPTNKFLEALTTADVATGTLHRIGAVRSGYQQPRDLQLSADGSAATWTMMEALGVGFSTTWTVFYARDVDWPLDARPPF